MLGRAVQIALALMAVALMAAILIHACENVWSGTREPSERTVAENTGPLHETTLVERTIQEPERTLPYTGG
jgi:hypothetical protein